MAKLKPNNVKFARSVGTVSASYFNSGGTEPVVPFTTATFDKTLTNPNGSPSGDVFGFGVYLQGDNALVTAPGTKASGQSYSGAAHYFDTSSGAALQNMVNPNQYSTPGSDYFGGDGLKSIADIDGNYAIIGAPGEDNPSGAGSGKAYIFDVTTGALYRSFQNPNNYDTHLNDNFGNAVAISGNKAFVSAKFEDESGFFNSGIVYVYDFVVGGAPTHIINNPNNNPNVNTGDQFGYDMVANSTYLAVSGIRDQGPSNEADSGTVYVFDHSGNLVYTFHNPNEYGTHNNDEFGYSLAINDSYLAVSSVNEDSASTTTNGVVYIYDLSTGTLVHTIKNPNPSTSYRFGNTLAMNGYAIAISEPYEASTGSNSGAVHLYKLSDASAITTIYNPNNYGSTGNDSFGWGVSLTSTKLAVGAYGEDSALGNQVGIVYLYDLS